MPNYITIIGNTLMQPICALSEKLLALPRAEDDVISHHPDERGYSTSICLLFAVMTESFIMRARYLNSENSASSERSFSKFIKGNYPNLTNLDELFEIFILRDAIAHNHLWRIESTSDTNIWTDLLKKEIDPLTQQWTDKKYNLFVDINNGKTQKLELHMIPTQINRTDVMKVLRVVVETLTYIDDAEDRALGFSNNYIMFHGDFINFTKAANILIENLS